MYYILARPPARPFSRTRSSRFSRERGPLEPQKRGCLDLKNAPRDAKRACEAGPVRSGRRSVKGAHRSKSREAPQNLPNGRLRARGAATSCISHVL